MKPARPPLKISLHTRFGLSLGAALLPFLLAILAGWLYLLPRFVAPMEALIQELNEEVHPAMDLNIALLKAAKPVHDYLINGDPAERAAFARLDDRVEAALAATRPEQFAFQEERELIKKVHQEWRFARRSGEALLALPLPVGNPAAIKTLKQFDNHLAQATNHLEQAHGIFDLEIAAEYHRAQAVRDQAMLLISVLFGMALLVTFAASTLLGRHVLTAVNTLASGARRLAAGDLAARVALERPDEFGELAQVFNAMAEELQKSQAALAELAARDGLTGLYNHRMFHVLLEDELGRAQRFKRPISLLLFDIDHFKRVNDTHGHLAGDAVLKQLSELLNREARAIDRICRYGGEEIAVLLPETGLETAAGIAERLRATVEAQPLNTHSGAPIHITVSIGIASWPAQAHDAQALIAAADTAMYAAKQSGRNRAVRYEPAPA